MLLLLAVRLVGCLLACLSVGGLSVGWWWLAATTAQVEAQEAGHGGNSVQEASEAPHGQAGDVPPALRALHQAQRREEGRPLRQATRLPPGWLVGWLVLVVQ